MKRLNDLLVSQLARPHGLLTGPMSALLNRGNRLITAHTIGALDLQPGEAVLEVGFGGGVGLDMVLAHEPGVQLAGVDISGDVVRRARPRYAELDLVEAGVERMPFEGGRFDAAFAVNVAYFWPDLPAALRELLRVLRPGGRLVLGVRPPATLAQLQFGHSGHREWTPEQYAAALAAAGFLATSTRRMPDPGGGASVVRGERPR
jgi:arsenite methyltransferase